MKSKKIYILTTIFAVALCLHFTACDPKTSTRVSQKTIDNTGISTSTNDVLKQSIKQTDSKSGVRNTSQRNVSASKNNLSNLHVFYAAQTTGVIGLYGNNQSDNPADNIFKIVLDKNPEQNDRVWLTYRLEGVEDQSNVVLSINDRYSKGGYFVKATNNATLQRIEISAAWLHKGENTFQFGVIPNSNYGYKISNLALEKESDIDTDRLCVNAGKSTYNNKVYIYGFIRKWVNTDAVKVYIDNNNIDITDGEFETIINTDSTHQAKVVAEYANGSKEIKTIKFRQNTNPTISYQLIDVPESTTKSFKQGFAGTLKTNNAYLTFDNGSLKRNCKLAVSPVRTIDLPALDLGLVNVTSEDKGFRFLPHGVHFKNDGATVALQYDRTKIPVGYTENDIQTFYFDRTTQHWVALEKDSVDTKLCMVVSKTTHFTDMINGVIKAPESPETQGFTPTMMNDIKAGDPTSKIQMIAPPTANNNGSANLSYNLEMPPARNGMSPQVTISYNSDGGSGWLGEGWDINVPSITVDTRWGVPRYDGVYETETYLLNGEMLVMADENGNTYLPHRTEKISRKSDRIFYLQNEGGFSKIIRHGSFPSEYYWEITDKNGTIYTYGGSSSELKGVISNGSQVIAEWKLKKIQELHGDYIEYNYTVSDEDIEFNNPSGIKAKTIYLDNIVAGTKVTNNIEHTKVEFINKTTFKAKQVNNGRWGFLTSSNRLLEKIIVSYENKKIRSYSFQYTEGAFNADILKSITQNTYENETEKVVAVNSLTYYQNVSTADNATINYVQDSQEWNLQEVSNSNFSNDNKVTNSFYKGSATALGGNETNTIGASLYIGFGKPFNLTKINTAGVSVSGSYAWTYGKATFVDINGDGLPDKLFRKIQAPEKTESLFFFPNITKPSDAASKFGSARRISGVNTFTKTYSYSVGGGLQAYFELAKGPTINGGFDANYTFNNTQVYFADVNSDGLLDIVDDGKVYFNYLTYENNIAIPNFTLNSNLTKNPINTAITSTNTSRRVRAVTEELLTEEENELAESSPLQDIVRVWEAPYDGSISIEGSVKLIKPVGEFDEEAYNEADGVRVAVQIGAEEKWSQTIAVKDETEYTPGITNLPVLKGQRIYFRVQSGNSKLSNGDFDQVQWSPVVKYNGLSYETDANGYQPAIYKSSEGNVISKTGNNSVNPNASFTIGGHFKKPVTSDAVTLKVILSNDKVIFSDSAAVVIRNVNGNIQVVDTTYLVSHINENFFEEEIYSETFSKDVVDKDITFTNLNENGGNNVRFVVSSESNVCWDRIKWQPTLSYMLDGENRLEQANVKYDTYQKIDGSGDFATNIMANDVVNVTFGLKSVQPEINSSFYLVLKGEQGVITRRQILINNGVIDASSNFDIEDFPDGNTWAECFVSDNSLDDFTGLTLHFTNTNKPSIPVSIYRAIDSYEAGSMWRNWGQFEYNADSLRYTQPIDESMLEMPDGTTGYSLKYIGLLPLVPDFQTHTYWNGVNSNIFINGDVMSAGRMRKQDVSLLSAYISRAQKVMAAGAVTVDYTKSDAPVLYSTSESYVVAGGVKFDLAADALSLGGSASGSWGHSRTRMDFQDMNGDGYPDYIYENKDDKDYTKIEYSTPLGARSGGVSNIKKFNRETTDASGGSIGVSGSGTPKLIHCGSTTSGEHSKTALTQISTQVAKYVKSLDVSAGALYNTDHELETFIDVNGDGLPDKVYKDESKNIMYVKYNLGYSFSDPCIWGNGENIRGGYCWTGNYGLGLGFNIDDGSFKGGYGRAGSNSYTKYSLIDINADGLVDKIWKDGNSVYTSFNLGNRFSTSKVKLGNANEINKSASTSNSFNVAVTLGFTKPVKYNPEANFCTSSTRTLKDIRDVDGDGYPDIIESEIGSQYLTVKRSPISKTNKLKTITNPFGGTVTLDYCRSEATSDHPGGKWVMKSVEVNDNMTNNPNLMKTEYEYQHGVQDRRNRTFIGFERVVSKNLDTENNNSVYRISYETFDVSNVLNKGTLISTLVTDGAGRKYQLSENEYYYYFVTPNNLGEYKFNTGVIGEEYIVYSPIKYTKTTLFEGASNGVITNESYYEYYVNDGSYGELRYFIFSDKGKLKDTNYSEYNYFTEVEEYEKNTAKHILSLPKKVTVKDKNTQYRHIVATYDTNFPNHLKTITQTLDKNGAIAVVEMEYDAYGNIKSKKLPENANKQRMTYTYEYDDKYKMYVTKVTDAFGYSSSLTEYNYQYGVPRVTTDINGKTMITEIDNLGRVEKIKGPNETDYTLKFRYYPQPKDAAGKLMIPYAITQHFDVNYPNDPIETVTFADGLGRPLQVKKDGEVWNSNSKTADKVMIVSGRVKYDAFGRVQKAFMPVTETNEKPKYEFNPAWGADPTESVYDILDRTTSVKLPDGNETKTTYSLTGDGLQKVLVEDAEKHTQATFYNGSGKVVRTEQYSGPDGTITTAFGYDGINQLIKVIDTKKSVTESEYDMAGRRTKVTHPASGITTFTFDASGNLTEKLTANLATNKQNPIKYSYDYNRLKEINYPAHPENDVRYIYGGTDAADNLKGRLIYVEDGSGAQQFSYGNMGELTEVRRTLIVPNQAVATYVTNWTYDSWNRVQTMKYPDGEVLTYGYNSAGLLTSVKGEKNNQKYDYVSAIGYDMYEQRSYMKYGNGTETAYNYNAKNRTLNTLQVVDKNSKALMNNTYTYDNVYNIRSVENNVTPTNGLGGYIKHEYQYDGLYRLKHASGSFNNNKASYTLDMTYDNLHNITHKKQQVQQTDMQFAGTLKAGYDLTYAYKYNPQQISTLADESYRNATDNNGTTGTTENEPNKKAQVYSYDSNGNLTAIESGQFGTDGTTLNKSTERRLLWDEENRLLAVTDNGFVSNYWYDAAGERTVKESGDGEGVQINGVLSGARTGTANYTVYVSPYTVVSNGGQMSKHIYIGSQRIVSKLIDAGTMDDPRNTAKATYTGSALNYDTKYATLTAKIKERYNRLGVNYRGKDYRNDAGNTFYIQVSPPEKERNQYFYHSDHLGSSSLITDVDGNLVQHIEYVPFGEVFIDERTVTNKWSTPYKFNAKELDDETGLYYYGARYYDPRTSVWISVDPLAEKMPTISSYVYCFDNPVRYIDPDGRYGSDGHYWTAYAMCISMGLSNEKSLEFAAHAERYDNVIKNSSSLQSTDLSTVREVDDIPTFINPTTQGSMHGLTGGSKEKVNFIAMVEALNGNLDAIHLVGDSHAHAFTKKSMYPRGFGHLFDILDADNIAKHKTEYNSYLNDLELIISLSTGTNNKADRAVFNIIEKNGNSNERTDILIGYIASKIGQKYTTSSGSENIRKAFNKLGINYTIQMKKERVFFGLFQVNRVISFTVNNQQ